MHSKELKKIIHSVSLDTYTDKDIVEEVFNGYYEIIKKRIESIDVEDYSTFPIVLIPSLGKLYVSNARVRRINEAKKKSKFNNRESIRK